MTELIHMLPYLIGAYLAVIGLYGMATSHDIIHSVVCFTVFQASVWIILLTAGFATDAAVPVFDDVGTGYDALTADPVMQAITITDIVVGAAVAAILLALAVQIHKRLGSLDPDNLKSIRG